MPETHSFEGSVMLFWMKKPARGGCLENVRVETVGDRSFFVGQLADDGSLDARTGMTYWFPVSGVQMIMQFANLEEARAYKSAWLDQKSKKSKS
jgi:hypothetical protein